MLTYGSIRQKCHNQKPAYILIINRAPWAKLITRMMPKMRLSPMAITAYSPPTRIPATNEYRIISITMLPFLNRSLDGFYFTSLPLQYYLLFQGGTGQTTEGDLGILTDVGDSGQRIPLIF